MSKKYIKGKDGKFQGSLPDPNALPNAVPSIAIPAHPSNRLNQTPAVDSAEEGILSKLNKLSIFKPVNDEVELAAVTISKKVYPGDIKAYYVVDEAPSISGSIYPNPNGTFTSTIDSTFYGESEEVSSVIHGSADEAENRVKKDLIKFGGYIASFDSLNGTEELKAKIDSAIASDSGWQGSIDETFGPKTSWMRSSKTNRGATVQRYKTGYYVRVSEYKTLWDKEGELMLSKSYPDFDTANAFAEFIVSGVSDN